MVDAYAVRDHRPGVGLDRCLHRRRRLRRQLRRLHAERLDALAGRGPNGNVQAVAVLDGIVYVGGHYTDYCGPQSGQHTCTNPIARSKLLAVEETTGTLNTTWHPAANSTLGVFAMDGSGGRLALGGDFTKLAGVNQQGFGEFVE